MPDLRTARAIADELVAFFIKGCTRIDIAGGVRRRKPDPHDVEIVAMPIAHPVGLFGMTTEPATDGLFQQAQADGLLRLDPVVKRNGERYKRFLYRSTETAVEFFLVHKPEQYGVILAIRTGPADFGRKVVTSRLMGGAMPVGMRVEGGWLMRGERRLKTYTEEDYFREIGIPYWPPEKRTLARLEGWLKEQRYGHA